MSHDYSPIIVHVHLPTRPEATLSLVPGLVLAAFGFPGFEICLGTWMCWFLTVFKLDFLEVVGVFWCASNPYKNFFDQLVPSICLVDFVFSPMEPVRFGTSHGT